MKLKMGAPILNLSNKSDTTVGLLENITVYTITWNEVDILQDFVDWYRSRFPDCKIVVYDNMSDDGTVELARQNNCEVIQFTTNGKMDEKTLIEIRNNCWKVCTTNWCVVVDADELVDVTPEILEHAGTTSIYRCEGYEMFGTSEDTIETLVNGLPSEGYCKPVVFKPWVFQDINFGPGSHSCNPVPKEGNWLLWDTTKSMKLYHTKWRSWEHGIRRAHMIANRVSEDSRAKGWNFHYALDDSIHLDYYSNGIKNSYKVR